MSVREMYVRENEVQPESVSQIMHVQRTCGMRTAPILVFVMSLLGATPGAPSGPDASASYFSHVRDLKISASDRQNYFVVDQDIWKYARPDLADLRLYNGAAQVPYILREERGGTSTEERAARILNLGSASGHTEFDIDVGASPQ